MITQNKPIVLIVDDSLLICNQIKSALKDEEIVLLEAHTGQEAMEMTRQNHPDMLLLDVVLPDADGYELCGRLKQENQMDAVIIFLTSKDRDEDVIKGFSMGACDYIKKPFAKGELQSRVHAHLLIKKQKDELNRKNQELQDNMEKLNYMAFRDGLTGLYNRRYVIGDLLEDIRDNGLAERKNVFILADIDDFKKINDTYGHEAGDSALVYIANIMESVCRRFKVVRWGGEEFLVILLDVTEQEAMAISERVRTEVEQFVIPYGDGEFGCTLTLGLHWFQEQEGIEEGINKADKALYYGKRNGKNQSVWYESITDGE